MQQQTTKIKIQVPTALDKMTLEQFIAYVEIADWIKKGTAPDQMQLLENVCLISQGSKAVAKYITQNNFNTSYEAVLNALPEVLKHYNKIGSNGVHRHFISAPVYDDGQKVRMKMQYKIEPDISALPAEIWADLLKFTKQLENENDLISKIKMLPKILARIAWSKNEPLIVETTLGPEVNRMAIAKKEITFLDVNALAAVKSYIFFLILYGIFSMTGNSQFLNKKSTILISSLLKKEKNLLNVGVGMDISKKILQAAMKLFSDKN